jgi:hypothetical protein
MAAVSNNNNAGCLLAGVILFFAIIGKNCNRDHRPTPDYDIPASRSYPADSVYRPVNGYTNDEEGAYEKPVKKKRSRIPASSRYYIRGPRGGCYYINDNGNKVYVDRSLCN